jgi:hypothetical protein
MNRLVREARQHQVDDVVGHVVLTGADEDLVAGDLVGAIALGLGLGAHQAQVGAAMRLGQAHAAGPLAAGHLVQIGLLLRLGAVLAQRRVGTVGQARVHGPGLVGAVEHFVKHLVQHQRQALAAKRRVTGQRGPTALYVLAVGLFETLGGGHRVAALVQRAAFGVATEVERVQHLGGKLAALLQHRIHGVHIQLGVLGNLLQIVHDVQQLVHHKLHVAQGRGVSWHGGGS